MRIKLDACANYYRSLASCNNIKLCNLKTKYNENKDVQFRGLQQVLAPKRNFCSILNKIKKTHLGNKIPTVSTPLIAYDTTQVNLQKKLTKEAINKKVNNATSHTVTDRVKKNVKELKKADVKDDELKKYFKSDGYLNDNGKKIVNKSKDKTNPVNFKGESENSLSKNLSIEDLPSEPSVSDINNVDISVPKVLQYYIDTPAVEVQEGLMSNITDVIPEGFDVDDVLKEAFETFLGVLD